METRELVDGALADPASGFAAIYDAYADRIHDYCNSILRSADDAADAAQDTFVLAYQRLAQLRDPDKLTAWLYAIARSRCLRRIDGRKRQQPVDDMELLTAADTDTTAAVDTHEARELVWAAAAGLADDDRAVLDAHLRHGLTGPELAGVLGVPTTKANQMLHRMKERMERTVGALVVLRAGRNDCEELQKVAGDGPLTPLIRKRVARHIDDCDICGATRQRLTPQLAYATIPLVPAPAALRGRVLEQTASVAAPGADATHVDAGEWRHDGFPDAPARRTGAGGAGDGRRLARILGTAAAIGMALLVGVGLGRLASDGDGSDVAISAPTTTTQSSTVPTDPATSTTDTTLPPATTEPGGTDPPGSTTTTTEPVDPDNTPPSLDPLTSDCSPNATVRATVTDALDPSPTADLELESTATPGQTVPMIRVGTSNVYEAMASRGRGSARFTVRGTVSDASGNTVEQERFIDCTIIE